jgi:hypothetical protein
MITVTTLALVMTLYGSPSEYVYPVTKRLGFLGKPDMLQRG